MYRLRTSSRSNWLEALAAVLACLLVLSKGRYKTSEGHITYIITLLHLLFQYITLILKLLSLVRASAGSARTRSVVCPGKKVPSRTVRLSFRLLVTAVVLSARITGAMTCLDRSRVAAIAEGGTVG